MNTFKKYAKQAKERMKSGFWQQEKVRTEYEKQTAAALGLDEHTVAEECRQRLQKKIYDYDGYKEEEEFYGKVVKIIESDVTVTNPIKLLADEKYVDKLSPIEKQSYYIKLAARYRRAVERYEKLHSKRNY